MAHPAGYIPPMAKQRRKRRTTDQAIDERVVRMRTAGCSFAEIKRATGAKPERIKRIVADWVEASVDPDLRKTVFVETLELLREMIAGAYPKAVRGHTPSMLAINRIIGRRNQMLGLKTPEQSIVRIIDESAPKQVSSMDRIEAALRQFKDQRSLAERAAELRRQLAELEPAIEQPVEPATEPPPAKNGAVVG
jgi:hypothetical protein